MGIEYSSESQEGLPVTGLPSSLEVLRVARGKWVKKETTILKLRENGSKYRCLGVLSMSLPAWWTSMEQTTSLWERPGRRIHSCFMTLRVERWGSRTIDP